MALRLLEHYASVQGEGPRVGTPTQFVRFAGCNLKCAAWPCDTPHAIDPKLFKPEQRLVAPNVLDAMVESVAIDTGAENICLTGGEPFIQRHDELQLFIKHVLDRDFTVEVFTNGTVEWPIDLLAGHISFVMDWKLAGSGEDPYDSSRLRNLTRMLDSMTPYMHAIKFTCASIDDFNQDMELWHTYFMTHQQYPDGPQIYVGPVWGKPFTAASIVANILTHRLPWKLNIQTHNYVWDAQERGR